VIGGLLLVGMLASATTAACPDPDDSRRFDFDESRAAAGFRVRAGGIKVRGDFQRLRGELRVGRDKARACVRTELEAASVTMGTESLSEWVRSAHFFDAERHPQLGFRSSAFAPRVLLRGGRIEGRLTLLGVTRQQSVLAQRALCTEPPDAVCTVRMLAALRRSAFGMRASRGVVGDRVDLMLRFEAPRSELEVIDDPPTQ